jgi:metallo-beta-lactamase class B
MTRLLPLLLAAALACAQHTPTKCDQCAAWNVPQKPFQVFGNTYYVGTHGLSSILVTSDSGHVLMDGALPESVPQVVANIRTLGFRIEDVKLIVNSHVHFDHAGGLQELQKLSGAHVVASPWSAKVLAKGGLGKGDPQSKSIPGIAAVAKVETLKDGENLSAGKVTITAHLTPGHTPGGTSWTWQSCEGSRCLAMVYADSVTAVSSDGFLFTKSKAYPNALADFDKSFTFLSTTPCDILLTTHPDVSNLWTRLDAHQMTDGAACKQLADRGREQFQKRIASERQ